MDTDTQVYNRFGTMTGPDVLVMGRAWADYILTILHEQMGALPRKPAFRGWVRLDLLPGPAQ